MVSFADHRKYATANPTAANPENALALFIAAAPVNSALPGAVVEGPTGTLVPVGPATPLVPFPGKLPPEPPEGLGPEPVPVGPAG